MGTHTDNLSIADYQDPVSVPNGSDSLGDDDAGNARNAALRPSGTTERRYRRHSVMPSAERGGDLCAGMKECREGQSSRQAADRRGIRERKNV